MIVPLSVIDELDKKKYARREEFQQRARELLTVIDRYETAAPDAYVQLREGVTFEVLPDEPGHFRAASTDQAILERCEFLAQVTGSPVSGDSGVRINARARGIEVIKLSEEDLLPRFRTPQQPDATQSDEDARIQPELPSGRDQIMLGVFGNVLACDNLRPSSQAYPPAQLRQL